MAEAAGAPKGSVGCLSLASMAGCQELMGAEQVRLILAKGCCFCIKKLQMPGFYKGKTGNEPLKIDE